ncbi:MAG: MerR family transcriptional regulator [Acidobacteria bacterium]|nr:MAG: MerR family transcriptional regulator [Acidobacteriota bacterium]
MPLLTISQVAGQIGLQPSAIRYYEQIGLLPRAQRMSGQRRYDPTVLYRFAIIQRARQLGFTLTEIRELFFGFRDSTRASERWRTLSQRKLAELDQLMDGIKAMRALLKKLMTKCQCDTLDECGKCMLRSMNENVKPKSVSASRRRGQRSQVSLRT